jgi:methylated-DNA-[protein]-cysteine S-methyltransferase
MSKIAAETSGLKCFGVLLDNHDLLLASSFGDNPKAVTSHLDQYSRKVTGYAPTLTKTALLDDMIEIYDGRTTSKKFHFNTRYISPYQSRVYDVLSKIPHGRVTTYGLVAKKLDSGPRAVGNAVATNPWPLFIPCQRVVPSTLSIGDYSICGSLSPQGSVVKRELLERENILFENNAIPTRVLWTPTR